MGDLVGDVADALRETCGVFGPMGLERARELLAALAERGIAVVDEMLVGVATPRTDRLAPSDPGVSPYAPPTPTVTGENITRDVDA